MNILLTSVGRRSYLVNYFKEVIGADGMIHVGNNSEITPAFQYADRSVVTPLIYSEEYIPFLLDYCINNEIDIIISLFDIDLPILSKNKDKFNEIGVNVIVSSEKVLNICNDKWKTYEFLIENGLNAPKTFISYDKAISSLERNEIEFPLIIKPRWGMGSISILEVENEEELRVLYNLCKRKIKESYLKYESEDNINEAVLIQEKICGTEYGLDIINNLNAEYQNTIIRKKYAMRSGETDCAKIVDNENILKVAQILSWKLKHIANLDVDVFIKDENVYVLEMNARFGGGYPFSHIAGADLPRAIVNWSKNEPIDIEWLEAKSGVVAHKDINIIRL